MALVKSLHPVIQESLARRGINELRPAQEKALDAGLIDGKSLLVCTPTASGKTLIAEIAIVTALLDMGDMGDIGEGERRSVAGSSGSMGRTADRAVGRAVYIVPLKALASEKYRQFREAWSHLLKVGITTGDLDSEDRYLESYNLVICTAEKLDSLIRHKSPVAANIKVVVIDEIHLMHDESRGPTLEMVITLLRIINPQIQIIGLSATIGNPEELASWLGAELVMDDWRPVKLKKGVFYNSQIEFDSQ